MHTATALLSPRLQPEPDCASHDPPPTCPRQARSGPKWTGAPTCHKSRIRTRCDSCACTRSHPLPSYNMSCCGRLCLRRSHLRALGRHDGLERPPRGLRREGCCQRYLGGGGESRAGGASHHGPRPPPGCAAGERASNSYGSERNRTRAPTEDRPSKVEGTQKKREFKRSGMQWS